MSSPPGAVGRSPPDHAREIPEAVVLAAGRGARLHPLTDTLPKVLVPVRGKPLLAYHLEACRDAGLRRAVLIVGYRADQIRAYVGHGEPFGLEVEYVHQEPPRGTGDAVRVARPAVRARSIVVCYGDVYFPRETEVLRRMLEDDRPKMAGARVPDGGRFGRLTTTDRGGRLILQGIREKDGQPTPGFVNAGLYLLPYRIFDLVDRLALSPRGEFELTDSVVRFSTEDTPIELVDVGPWVDIADLHRLAEAEGLADSHDSRPG
jgi:UDP-N-acetylglucosamine diphosphorylase / glucose-1-phosphate thymidylyltransferase / UDP-N-acetylgalactosamine diphosphorylase / glucosamine-1-phosphate N-acetyltransferase / galactosamine-1-phosphate N-acetyltransferase